MYEVTPHHLLCRSKSSDDERGKTSSQLVHSSAAEYSFDLSRDLFTDMQNAVDLFRRGSPQSALCSYAEGERNGGLCDLDTFPSASLVVGVHQTKVEVRRFWDLIELETGQRRKVLGVNSLFRYGQMDPFRTRGDVVEGQ